MEKTWIFQILDEQSHQNHEHEVMVDGDLLNRRSFYFDGDLIYQESYIEAFKNNLLSQGEIKTIYNFEEYGCEFYFRQQRRFLKLYINGKDADVVTRFTSYDYPQQNNPGSTFRNTHAWFKEIIVPIVIALLGSGGIIGLIKSCQELTSPTNTVSTLETTAIPQENNSVCRLQSGAYKAAVTRDKGLGLRAKPLESDTIIKRISFNTEIIVLRETKIKDGIWRYVCLEGSSIEGWVIGKYTKKI